MRKIECDECGKRLKKIWYTRNVYEIIGITGNIKKYVLARGIADTLIASQDTEIEFEVCSKKCMLHYLRKKVVK